MKVLLNAAIAASCLSLGAADAKMMSYNVMHCEGADRKVDIARVAAVIAAESPAYVGVQELDRVTKRSYGVDQLAELGRILGMKHTFAKAIDFGGGGYGVGVLSREEPISVFTTPLPGKEPRILLLCEFKDFWFGTTHLSVAAESERVESIAIIRKAVLERAVAKPVFLTGDWNAKPESTVLAGMRDFMTVVSGESRGTFHGFRPPQPEAEKVIDYIAVDKAHAAAFSVRDRRVVENREASDHFPVAVTVSRNAGAQVR